jgi:hypothetical protein
MNGTTATCLHYSASSIILSNGCVTARVIHGLVMLITLLVAGRIGVNIVVLESLCKMGYIPNKPTCKGYITPLMHTARLHLVISSPVSMSPKSPKFNISSSSPSPFCFFSAISVSSTSSTASPISDSPSLNVP